MYEGTKAYNPKVHGTLEEYLEMFPDGPLFHGPEHYEMLWDLGVLGPEISSLRINGAQQTHESYFVIDREHIEAMTGLRHYAGVEGRHIVREFLTGRRAIYEVHSIDRRALTRSKKS